MKLSVKTLQQKVFSVEVEPETKVLEIKQKIEASQQFPIAQQKLIHSGKILTDDTTVADAKIKETDFVVVMVTKPKPAPPTASSSSAPAPAPAAPVAPAETTPAAPPAPAPAAVTDVAADAPAAAAPPAPAPAPAAATEPSEPTAQSAPVLDQTTFDASTLATGTAYQAAVQNLIEMGFPREEVERAMRAAFNNPDRAAEYLMTGIPESVQAMGAPARAPASGGGAPAARAAPPAAAGEGATPAGGNDAGYVNLFDAGAAAIAADRAGGGRPEETSAVLARLRESPQFQQLRDLVRNQPQLLAPLLQQIGQQNPEIFQAIQQNQDQFLQMLNDGEGDDFDGGDFEDDDDDDDAMPGIEGAAGAAGGAAPGRPRRQYINITPEDDAAINRLAALGFDRIQAAEAYFACDKNEELAANFLFDSMGQDDM
ncbi:hypothetical protein HK405_003152 [Cladochytrium tenue]|nr:hypothetical protein HK405_003152 [Cladochytrium tenue]